MCLFVKKMIKKFWLVFYEVMVLHSHGVKDLFNHKYYFTNPSSTKDLLVKSCSLTVDYGTHISNAFPKQRVASKVSSSFTLNTVIGVPHIIVTFTWWRKGWDTSEDKGSTLCVMTMCSQGHFSLVSLRLLCGGGKSRVWYTCISAAFHHSQGDCWLLLIGEALNF